MKTQYKWVIGIASIIGLTAIGVYVSKSNKDNKIANLILDILGKEGTILNRKTVNLSPSQRSSFIKTYKSFSPDEKNLAVDFTLKANTLINGSQKEQEDIVNYFESKYGVGSLDTFLGKTLASFNVGDTTAVGKQVAQVAQQKNSEYSVGNKIMVIAATAENHTFPSGKNFPLNSVLTISNKAYAPSVSDWVYQLTLSVGNTTEIKQSVLIAAIANNLLKLI